ncbi:MAG: hypothetical protein K2M91_02690, partial [Lachnospiraceae bacterium]|nr:hypothetical protein [Lachnospiraceae bacterium]
MIRIGNRAMDVYMSNELKPRSRGIVQSSTNNTDKAVRENRDTVQIHDTHIMDIDTVKRAYDISLKSTHCNMEHVYT